MTKSQPLSLNWDEGVSIIIPTFQRPEGIKISLGSVLTQSVKDRAVEIIVADNDPKGSAKETVTSFMKTSPFPIHYVHIPEPGVSNARNGAMAHAKGRFIIFLDDDMEALDDWIENLIATSLKFDAGIVFGPAIAKMPNPNDPRNPYMEPFFSRIANRKKEGIMHETLGTGGCLLDLKHCDMPSPVFDTSLNETGGEDDVLFDHLRRTGSKVAWSPEAKAWEHVPAKRATEDYIRTRNFAFGQGPTHLQALKGIKGIPGVLRFMTTGFIQLCMYAPVYLLLKATKHPAYIKYLARSARGLGKIFWWDSLSPKLYGSAILKTDPAPVAE